MQRVFGGEVTRSNLAHAQRQQEQGSGNLVAQQNRQQHRGQHGHDQTQCECADVHFAKPVSGQCTLLVFPIGQLNIQGIGHQSSGKFLRNLQNPGVITQVQAVLWHQREHFDAPAWCTHRFVQPFHNFHAEFAAHLFELGCCGPLWPNGKTRLPRRGNKPAIKRPQHSVVGIHLGANSV